MKEMINLLCATDNVFAPYCGIMLTSVFENNHGNVIQVFILASQSLRKRNVKRFAKLGERYGQIVRIITVDDSLIKDLCKEDLGRLTIATYYRLFVTRLLPDSVNKVLYFDCDCIVTRDLSQIWELNMDGKAVAAVPGICLTSDECQRLHYPSETGYFNAGVLLINLDYWRSERIGLQFIEFIKNYSGELVFHDQDVLNAILWKTKQRLPLTYNFQCLCLSRRVFDALPSNRQKEIVDTIRSLPCVIHFNGAMKPWNKASLFMPYRDIWRSYKNKSLWSHLLPTIPSRKRINWLIKCYLLWPLGLLIPDNEYLDIGALK